MRRSKLGLHLPDADHFTSVEIAAISDLSPSVMLAMCYCSWQQDKGAAAVVRQKVRELGHTDLFVRFHADPNPIDYAAQQRFRLADLSTTLTALIHGRSPVNPRSLANTIACVRDHTPSLSNTFDA